MPIKYYFDIILIDHIIIPFLYYNAFVRLPVILKREQ